LGARFFLFGGGGGGRRLTYASRAYTLAVCVSFTIPTLEIGKLLVCLGN
jgi:hypothetical protein